MIIINIKEKINGCDQHYLCREAGDYVASIGV
jgi:hypothetical protein